MMGHSPCLQNKKCHSLLDLDDKLVFRFVFLFGLVIYVSSDWGMGRAPLQIVQ